MGERLVPTRTSLRRRRGQCLTYRTCVTQINGENIGKGKSRLLHDGNEIAFGSALPQPPERAGQDYREWRDG